MVVWGIEFTTRKEKSVSKSWIKKMLFGIILTSTAWGATTLKDWFDYHNCDFCKQWAAQPGLIAHARDEYRPISDGILWITYVENDFRDEFAKMQAAEDQVSRDLADGESVRLCQFCSRISDFSDHGVRIEMVAGSDAFVTIFTSTDTALVRSLHEFGAQAVAEEAIANAAYLSTSSGVK